MVNPIKSCCWLCEECGNDYDFKDEAEECCKKKNLKID